MQDAEEVKRKTGIRMIVWSALIGLICGLAYELTGYLLQFAWGSIELQSGPMSQIRFLQAFLIGLLVVALAGFLPAMIFRAAGRELIMAPAAGAISGAFTGITLVLFDYMQHFNYFADRAFSLSCIRYVINAFAISPQFTLLITGACAIIASISALLYMKLDLDILISTARKHITFRKLRLYPVMIVGFIAVAVAVPLVMAVIISASTPAESRMQPSSSYVVAIHAMKVDNDTVK